MLEVVFLGTSGSMPTTERGLPSVAMIKEGEVLLFDCGEGTQRQAMHFGINISKISAIFITHLHGDHVLGIPGLARTLALYKRTAPLYIYVPKGGEKIMSALMKFDKALVTYPIIIKGVNKGTVFKNKDFEISTFALMHSVEAIGYCVKEPDKIRFKKDESRKLGLKGTMFSELEKKKVLIVNGKKIKLSQVTYVVPGKKIVYASDTRPTNSTINAARGAELLIHEASFAKAHQKLAKERWHSTADEAALIAKKARVKRLALFHISARYKTSKESLNDARKVFKNTIVAEDGYRIMI